MNFGTRRALERLADDRGHFRMLAVDQRPPVQQLVARSLGRESAPMEAVRGLKRQLVEALASQASAVLVDPHTAFASSDCVSPRQGLIMTLESSDFGVGPEGRTTHLIDHWSVDKIKRIGADGVKFLAWYRPDAGRAVIEHQQQLVADVGAACRRQDIPFIFELLLYPFDGEPNDPRFGGRRTDMVLESVETFADPVYAVDVFKLESPMAIDGGTDVDDTAALRAFHDLHRAAGRPWVLLSGGAAPDAFFRMLSMAYRAGASGYLAGRSIWWQAIQHHPDTDAIQGELEGHAFDYMQRINWLTAEAARSFRTLIDDRPSWESVPHGYASPFANDLAGSQR